MSWQFLALAAVVALCFAGIYVPHGVPLWIVIYALASAIILALFALAVYRAGDRLVADPWIYGTCNRRRARRHRLTGQVQFLIWPKGSRQGDYVYPEDYWVDFDRSWWAQFTIESAPQTGSPIPPAPPSCAAPRAR